MHHIYSTLSTDMRYASYRSDTKESILERAVLIKGGANVCDKHLFTPKGIVTQVNDDDLKFLEQNEVFKMHVKNGYIKVEKSEKKIDKVVCDMQARDISAPKQPEDFPMKQKEAA
jgi:hypothetical protein